MEGRLQNIAAAYEADLDRVMDIASARFNKVVRDTLEAWAERFPRHAFRAWEGHGLMSLQVSPKVCGVGTLELETATNYRGALAEIIEEANTLVNFFNEMEVKACLNCDEQARGRVDLFSRN